MVRIVRLDLVVISVSRGFPVSGIGEEYSFALWDRKPRQRVLSENVSFGPGYSE